MRPTGGDGEAGEATSKRARVHEAIGFKDVCWKSQPVSDLATGASSGGDENNSIPAAGGLFSFNF